MLNNREESQAREPSKCLNRQSYRERLAKEAFWLPVNRGLKKDSDRGITSAAKAVCVPTHLALSRCLWPKQLCHLPAQLSLGQSSHMGGCFNNVQLFVTLWIVACQASLSVGFSRQEYWSELPYPSRALYFQLPYPPTPLSNWCCQMLCNPSSCTTSTLGPHWGRPKSSRELSDPNLSGQPTSRGWNKTTIEIQGQCG